MRRNRVFVIGWDAADYRLTSEWVVQGKLPNLARLIREGTWGPLRSTIHPITPVAWTSFATGKSPGRHGFFDFVRMNPRSYALEINSRLHLKEKPLWMLLSEADRQVGVVNLPETYPPDRVNGFIVSGVETPSTDVQFTYPPELGAKILGEVGDYLFSPDDWSSEDTYLEGLKRMEELRYQTLLYLLREYPDIDFLTVLFDITDRAMHFFWRYMDASHYLYDERKARRYGNVILESYQIVDGYLGELLKILPSDAVVIVMSDHGSGGRQRELNLNKWLRDQGWLQLRKRVPADSSSISGRQKLVRLVHTLDVFKLRRWLLPLSIREEINPRPVERSLMATLVGVDWKRTQAYAYGAWGNININLQGREANGIVPPEKYEAVRTAIINALEDLRNPMTGTRVVEKVYRREELYQGPYMEEAPDLIVATRDCAYQTRTRATSEHLFEKPYLSGPGGQMLLSGAHRMDGILVVWGPGVERGQTIESARIIDLAPTILYHMGLPVPADMDGRPLIDAFTADYVNSNPVLRGSEPLQTSTESQAEVFSSEEAAAVEERLRGLGYIE